jgi:hypothetical protein
MTDSLPFSTIAWRQLCTYTTEQILVELAQAGKTKRVFSKYLVFF